MKFTLPLPPTLNSSYRAAYTPSMRRTMFFMTKEAKRWKSEAQMELESKRPNGLIISEVAVTATVYSKRDRDCDASGKIILDALQGSIIDDDRQVRVFTQIRAKDKDNPRVEIELKEI